MRVSLPRRQAEEDRLRADQTQQLVLAALNSRQWAGRGTPTAAPSPPLPSGPPSNTTLPSAESATDGAAFPKPLCPASSFSCVHSPPLRVNTAAAPALRSWANPPTRAMLPSTASATDAPCWVQTPPVAASLWPCCVQTPLLRVNTQAAPAAPAPNRSDGLSPGPPRMAVLPSAESATDVPCRALPTAPLPTSFLPCCFQTSPLRANTHAVPVLLASDQPPTIAVLPSADNATDMPCRAAPTAPLPTSFLPCCVHTSPLRMNTKAPSARHAPTMAVLPSAESATDIPWPKDKGGSPGPEAPVPTNFLPCCAQTPPLRLKTQAAPVVLLSLGPPTMAILPSPDSATDTPWDHKPPPSSLVVPISLLPCWVQTLPPRVNTHAAPAGSTGGARSRSALLAPGPPTMAVLPSADSATDVP